MIAAARTLEKAQAACDEVGGETTPVGCELSEPASVRACAAQVIGIGRPLDARSMNPIARVALSIGAPLVLKSLPEGAATQCYVAVHPNVEGATGKYFADCNESTPSSKGRDEEMAAKLWEVSEKIAAEVAG